MPETTDTTKTDLLQELESIQGLLCEDDIPVLQEVIEQLEYRTPDADSQPLAPAQPLAPDSTDARQAPCDQRAATSETPRHDDSNPRGRGENPFLPQHIRSRLRGNRSSESPRATAAASARSVSSRQALIDALVAEVMPQLEKSLRLKLTALSHEQISQLQTKK